MSAPRFTAEQRAAVEDRSGSSLLAANAGSGKTAVMVERFVEAVRIDGVAVGAILALTFTEKAAGELRERVRRRLSDLGEDEHARAVDGAWIGTIHGFCAAILRSRPLAAGLDPRFEVLDEAAAGRLATVAYDRALDEWAAALGAPAVDLAAAYGPGLRDIVLAAHETLRSRGERDPRLPIPDERPAPDPAALAEARAVAARELAIAGAGVRVTEGRAALDACERLLGTLTAPEPADGDDTATGGRAASGGTAPSGLPRPGVHDAATGARAASGTAPSGLPRPGVLDAATGGPTPWGLPRPGVLDAAKLGAGAKALTTPACEAYREAWTAYRSACADHHARAALILIDDLLARFDSAYAQAKAARAGVDFEDLELGVRDLLSDEAERRRWSERFALIMVDEFQDTNRLQLELLERLERDPEPTSPAGTGNLFAVGDEFQSIYRFRHADVEIFRERRERLAADRVRGLAVNFRSSAELLDVLNAAFAPVLGPAFQPLVAGRAESPAPPPARGRRAEPEGALRLFDPDPPAGEPPVELLITDTRGWEEHAGTIGLAALAEQPWRRAEARLVAHRLREEVDAGRRPGDVVVLVRATASLRLFEQALEDQGLPTYVVGGRGYWSQEQVRDGLAYLAALANPQDEEAFYAVLASPFCGASADGLILLADAGRATGRGPWAALRDASAARNSSPLAGGDPATPPNGIPLAGGDAAAPPNGVPLAGGDAAAPPNGVPLAGGDAAAPPNGLPLAGGDPAASPDAVRHGAPAWLESLPAADRDRLAAFARFFAAERARAERLPVESLLERAITRTGYDLSILARAGGERRLANLRKLMRLARDYEHAEGRDLRGFLTYAATQDLAQAREGEAALESDGLDAVRLMTIHRAKGLEFPVVCVADLGRLGTLARPRLLIGRDRNGRASAGAETGGGAPGGRGGGVGLRLAALGGGEPVTALAYDRLAAEEDLADAEEERRLLYVAMTRARDRLILSGGTDCERWPEPRPGGAPLDWIVRAVAGDERRLRQAEPDELDAHGWGVGERSAAPVEVDADGWRLIERSWDGRPARVRWRISSAAAPDAAVRAPEGPRPRTGAPATALPTAPKVMPAPPVRPRPAPQRLSYTALQAYAKCPYRFYLQRVLGLPSEAPPPPLEAAEPGLPSEPPPAPLEAPEPTEHGLDPRVRGSLVHVLLERIDFAAPAAPDHDAVAQLAATHGVELTAADVEDIRSLVAAFGSSPLCDRLAAASAVRREAGFAFALEPGGGGALVNGFVDVMATEGPDRRVIVDYKSDRLDGADPAEVVDRDYATQRVVYALAALKDGAERVDVAYCFLERPGEPVVRGFGAAEADALVEQVVGLARGVLEERYPVTETPHRELCGDCPGRAALCSHPESRTLAPAVAC